MERLQQIEEIFQEALQHDPAEREAYVREACGGDTELQREVSSLLANHNEAGDVAQPPNTFQIAVSEGFEVGRKFSVSNLGYAHSAELTRGRREPPNPASFL